MLPRAKLKIRLDRVEDLRLLRKCEIKLNSQIEKPLLLLVPDEISGGVSGQADLKLDPTCVKNEQNPVNFVQLLALVEPKPLKIGKNKIYFQKVHMFLKIFC